MTTLSLRLPDDLKAAAAAQAERSGVSLNQYITAALAGRVAAQAATEEFFRMRTTDARREDMLDVLQKAGKDRPAQKGDELTAA
ncbi:MAG: toxin-antitoxin system HicB family antitoxin [Azospirillaceae bacterium]|nr:toxin-antitoxin system HicB family antitoxin [Azospirillaceae bacterium]